MSGEAPERTGNTPVTLVSGGGVAVLPASIEERRRLVAESLRIGNPANNARDLPTHADPRQDCHIQLNVEDIHPYEHNPRRVTNAKFAEIKESIRSCGIRNPPTVTRRQGEKHFIIEAGGNTRLLAIQELWAETGEARFQKLTVLFRPWCSESHVLTAHLIENDQRGEMTFWDKANGVVALKTQLEAEQGRALSLKQLEGELKGIGMSVNTATLSHYLFASDRLRILGEAVTDLSGLDVKMMQPRLNVLKRYAQQRAPIAEGELYATVFEPAFRSHAERYRQTLAFSASAVCEACEEALAEHLHEPVTQVRTALREPVQPPRVSSKVLPSHGCKTQAVPPAEVPPASGEPAPDCSRALEDAGSALANSEERHASPDPAARSTSGESAIRARLIAAVQRFADLAGIGDGPRLHPSALHGYFMQALPIPGDEESPQRLMHRARQLLALISAQLEESSTIDRSHDSCEARRSADTGANCVEKEPVEMLVFDAGFLAWLLNTRDEAAGAFWQLVTLVRELRASAPPSDTLAGRHFEMTRSA